MLTSFVYLLRGALAQVRLLLSKDSSFLWRVVFRFDDEKLQMSRGLALRRFISCGRGAGLM